ARCRRVSRSFLSSLLLPRLPLRSFPTRRSSDLYLLDPRIVPGTRWITGANVDGRHVFDLVAGRDFTSDGTIEGADVRAGDPAPRSEEHTSELQSRFDLVCRLLLEKKKKQQRNRP